MSFTARNRRLPLSCEACRSRKIRCPRDGPPCSTCTRRGLSQDECYYTKPPRSALIAAPSAGRNNNASNAPISPFSDPPNDTSPASGGTNEKQLHERVQRLERLLSSQDRPSSAYRDDDRGVAGHGRSYSSGFSSMPSSSSNRSAFSGIRASGSLRTTPTGHVRYVPQAYNMDATSNLPFDPTASSRSKPMGAGTDLEALLAALPPRSACSELVRTFFTAFASLFHVLHDPTFQHQYERFLQDAESVRLEWLALLYAILATAVISLSPDDQFIAELSRKRSTSEKIAELSERWRAMSLRCLEADQYLWRHNVTTLQCLVLLIYGIGHTHGQTWTLLGLTHHLAQSIGCHVDPAAFAISEIEREERRRCWAALMMLYTNQNTTTGMIGPSRESIPFTSQLPRDIDDDEINENGPPESVRSSPRATQMTYLLLKFRLYDICSEISTQVLTKSEPGMHIIRALDAAICEEQSSWQARYLQDRNGHSLPPHHAAHLNVLYSYSDHLTLLLHQKATSKQPIGDPIQSWSNGRKIETAKRLIRTHASLEENEALAPFRWYNRGLGSFHAFHAATVLYMLLRFEASPEEICERLELLNSCQRRLQTLSKFSSMCAEATAVLQRLVIPIDTPESQNWQFPTNVAGQEQEPPFSRASLTSTPAYDSSWAALFDPMEPQQWMTPNSFPWEQWSSVLESNALGDVC